MFNSLEIANYFIRLSKRDKVKLDNLQLQKLVYIAHGWYLGYKGEPLLDELPQAWRHGPVVPTVYHSFKDYGPGEIDKYAKVLDFGKLDFVSPSFNADANKETAKILGVIWDHYKQFSGIELVNLTHQKGTPWDTTVKPYISKSSPIPRNLSIKNETIKNYYSSRIKNTEKADV